MSGVLVLSGYGLRLSVERGHLVAEDGLAGDRRCQRFSRIDATLKRVVIMGHAGTISLDAIRWLHAVGVPLTHLDTDGTVFGVLAPASAVVPALRRRQAMALDAPWAFDLARGLIARKIRAQRDVLERLDARAARELGGVLDRLDGVTDRKALRVVEAIAAKAYWRAWRNVSVRFARGDAARRPAHWQTFGARVSSLDGQSPRKAVNPANAILNYLYALLEAEATVAAYAVGLDPALGILHTDARARPSLACDLMEPVRPLVDAFLLDLLARETFANATFLEHLDGHTRLLAPLTTQLAETCATWSRAVLPVAQELAQELSGEPTKATTKPRRARRVVQREYRPRVIASEDGRRAPEAGARRRSAMLDVKAANEAWEAANAAPQDPAFFQSRILPAIQGVPLAELVARTGLTKSACSRIRAGAVVPHPRHWDALR